MRMTAWARAGMCAGALACLWLAGCSKNEKALAKGADPAPAAVESAPDLNVAALKHPERVPLVRVESRRVTDEFTATGVVAPDVNRSVPVNSMTAGRVLEIRARIGDEVRKGQVLLRMTSADISGALADYRKFRADEQLTKTQLERSQLLYSHGAIAQKDLQVAEDTYNKAKVDTEAAAERIRILGGDLNGSSGLIDVRAPVSGTITEQNVTTAAGVKSLDNSPNLFTIADLSRVWVLCDVYENNLAQVHVGDRAEVELNAYPGRRFSGKVSNIASVLDPATRAAKVRIELANANRAMRPNMFATVHFMSQTARDRMVLPVSAVLRLQDRDWTFVKIGGNRFRRTEIRTGPANPDATQQVLSGVQPGDTVAGNALEFSRLIEAEQEQAAAASASATEQH